MRRFVKFLDNHFDFSIRAVNCLKYISILLAAVCVFDFSASARSKWYGVKWRHSAKLGILAKGGPHGHCIITFEWDERNKRFEPHVDDYAWYYDKARRNQGGRANNKTRQGYEHKFRYDKLVYIFGKGTGWNSGGRPHLDIHVASENTRDLLKNLGNFRKKLDYIKGNQNRYFLAHNDRVGYKIKYINGIFHVQADRNVRSNEVGKLLDEDGDVYELPNSDGRNINTGNNRVTVANYTKDNLIVGHKRGGAHISRGRHKGRHKYDRDRDYWKHGNGHQQNYAFNNDTDIIWFDRDGDGHDGYWLAPRDWKNKNRIKRIEIHGRGSNNYKVQVQTIDNKWFCATYDQDKRCSYNMKIHKNNKGEPFDDVDGKKIRINYPGIKSDQNPKFHPLTPVSRDKVIKIQHIENGDHVWINQPARNIKLEKNGAMRVNFISHHDDLGIHKINGRSLVLRYEDWKPQRVQKFAGAGNRIKHILVMPKTEKMEVIMENKFSFRKGEPQKWEGYCIGKRCDRNRFIPFHFRDDAKENITNRPHKYHRLKAPDPAKSDRIVFVEAWPNGREGINVTQPARQIKDIKSANDMVAVNFMSTADDLGISFRKGGSSDIKYALEYNDWHKIKDRKGKIIKYRNKHGQMVPINILRILAFNNYKIKLELITNSWVDNNNKKWDGFCIGQKCDQNRFKSISYNNKTKIRNAKFKTLKPYGVLVRWEGGNHIYLQQGNGYSSKLWKKTTKSLNFNSNQDSIGIDFVGDGKAGILFKKEIWKDGNTPTDIIKGVNVVYVHTVDKSIFCYGSKCPCKFRHIKRSGETIKGINGKHMNRTYNEMHPSHLPACKKLIKLGYANDEYYSKIRKNESNLANKFYMRNLVVPPHHTYAEKDQGMDSSILLQKVKKLTHSDILEISNNKSRRAIHIPSKDLDAIGILTEWASLDDNDTTGKTNDKNEIFYPHTGLALAKAAGWDGKWIDSKRGLFKKEVNSHILILQKIHPVTKVGVISISTRPTGRKSGWENNIRGGKSSTNQYGFGEKIQVHEGYHNSLRSSWSKQTSDIKSVKNEGGIKETLDRMIDNMKQSGALDIQFIISGHSQGGGMAQLIAAKLVGTGYVESAARKLGKDGNDRLWLINYGAPGVFNNAKSAQKVENAIGRDNILRFWRQWDAVPFLAKHHIGTSLMVEAPNGVISYINTVYKAGNKINPKALKYMHKMVHITDQDNKRKVVDKYKGAYIDNHLLPLYLHNRYPHYADIARKIEAELKPVIKKIALKSKANIIAAGINYPIYTNIQENYSLGVKPWQVKDDVQEEMLSIQYSTAPVQLAEPADDEVEATEDSDSEQGEAGTENNRQEQDGATTGTSSSSLPSPVITPIATKLTQISQMCTGSDGFGESNGYIMASANSNERLKCGSTYHDEFKIAKDIMQMDRVDGINVYRNQGNLASLGDFLVLSIDGQELEFMKTCESVQIIKIGEDQYLVSGYCWDIDNDTMMSNMFRQRLYIDNPISFNELRLIRNVNGRLKLIK